MIGDMNFKSRIFLAPMAGITDRPMRRLIASLGAGNIVSEMVAVNALQRRNPKSYRIADVREENYPVIVQLVGGEPQLFAEAAKLVAELGAFSLDINMGCPKNRQQQFRLGVAQKPAAGRKNHRKRCAGHTVESQRQIPQRLGQHPCQCR